MTAQTAVVEKQAWTPEEENRIKEIMETTGCNRSSAIRVMQVKVVEKKVAKPAVVKAAKPVKEAKPKKERVAPLSHKALVDAGICVKCCKHYVAKAEKDEKPAATCAICSAMRVAFIKTKNEKREWDRKNFFATKAYEAALLLSPAVKS